LRRDYGVVRLARALEAIVRARAFSQRAAQ
jgi:hypothetical protein